MLNIVEESTFFLAGSHVVFNVPQDVVCPLATRTPCWHMLSCCHQHTQVFFPAELLSSHLSPICTSVQIQHLAFSFVELDAGDDCPILQSI